ncbi:enoyl-CoA hydratase/isomerase family protein [Rhodococcus opacus RKJ300 = JCM 13270]|uniref:Enoyl-CoA hydratase/isomerase family protein n=1 Tax=Rhodococcus opacus RKJ300 = JCM 13270 TaxID=1165867 RepID=I0WC09_RHOOP|nr:enoyl-CoA hydratase-related protein [Rhodococcus opacus]EID73925.1 enoyl-CoA hydratase/isomerase family protein [Rhodococcus opacus RKJ300 = JCM 13270]QQZ16736.1 enoyl-CoA hydratase/isomerase family protein [Rhodococcus sp. 21391]
MTVERSGKRNRRGAAFLERHGPIAVITLNRPEVRNVVNSDVSAAVGAAMETLAHSPDLRVGILTGAGDTFCAGADLAALTAGHSIDAPGHPEWGFGGFVRHDIGKPLIAAVNGSSSGGGLDLILACDAAIVSSHASLGSRGIGRYADCDPDARALGGRLQARSVFLGDALEPETALRCGMIDRVVHPHEVLPEAMRLARALATTIPPLEGIGAAVMRRRAGRNTSGHCERDAPRHPHQYRHGAQRVLRTSTI